MNFSWRTFRVPIGLWTNESNFFFLVTRLSEFLWMDPQTRKTIGLSDSQLNCETKDILTLKKTYRSPSCNYLWTQNSTENWRFFTQYVYKSGTSFFQTVQDSSTVNKSYLDPMERILCLQHFSLSYIAPGLPQKKKNAEFSFVQRFCGRDPPGRGGWARSGGPAWARRLQQVQEENAGGALQAAARHHAPGSPSRSVYMHSCVLVEWPVQVLIILEAVAC